MNNKHRARNVMGGENILFALLLIAVGLFVYLDSLRINAAREFPW